MAILCVSPISLVYCTRFRLNSLDIDMIGRVEVAMEYIREIIKYSH